MPSVFSATPFRLILIVLLGFWAAAATEAAQPPMLRVVISVDTETSSGCSGRSCNPVPMEERIYGRRSEGDYGVPLIMDLLEKHGMKGVFFVNSTLDAYYPEDAIREMVQSIVKRGHDVQLHLHPEFRCFKFCNEDDLKCRSACVNRENRLAGNTVSQQRALIEEGLDNLERWAGYRPVSFRAGSFRADENTLEALRQAGVLMDSSLGGPDHPLARLRPPNRATEERGLVELPVFHFTSLKLGGYTQHRRFDLESNSFAEMKAVLEQAIRHGSGTVMTILHSFSFCRPEGGCPNRRAIEDFDRLLGWLATTPGVRVVTIPEWLDEYHTEPAALAGSGYVPQTGYWLTLWRSWQRWDEGGKNKAIVIAHGAILVVLSAGVFLGLRKVRRGENGAVSSKIAPANRGEPPHTA